MTRPEVRLPSTTTGCYDGVIYIYDAESKAAVRTLKHEFLDEALTSRVVKPLVEIINLLIKSREAEVYKAKKEFVEKLSKLLQERRFSTAGPRRLPCRPSSREHEASSVDLSA